jgi:DNA-binding NarL/FixJ family response regulator
MPVVSTRQKRDPPSTVPAEPTQSSLLIIAPDDLRWAAVRLLLGNMPDVEVMGDAARMEDALPHAAVPAPDAVLSAAALEGQQTLPVLQQLRDRWPGLKIIVLLDHRDEQVNGYAALPDASCLCWTDLTTPSLRYCLLATLYGSLRIFTRSVPDAGAPASQEASSAATEPGDLPPRARAVLAGLAAGRTEQQIAHNERVSLRTVQRAVADLQTLLSAPSLFLLGVQVERLGLLRDEPMAHSRTAAGAEPTQA